VPFSTLDLGGGNFSVARTTLRGTNRISLLKAYKSLLLKFSSGSSTLRVEKSY
jgi:hypothetical protein